MTRNSIGKIEVRYSWAFNELKVNNNYTAWLYFCGCPSVINYMWVVFLQLKKQYSIMRFMRGLERPLCITICHLHYLFYSCLWVGVDHVPSQCGPQTTNHAIRRFISRFHHFHFLRNQFFVSNDSLTITKLFSYSVIIVVEKLAMMRYQASQSTSIEYSWRNSKHLDKKYKDEIQKWKYYK